MAGPYFLSLPQGGRCRARRNRSFRVYLATRRVHTSASTFAQSGRGGERSCGRMKRQWRWKRKRESVFSPMAKCFPIIALMRNRARACTSNWDCNEPCASRALSRYLTARLCASASAYACNRASSWLFQSHGCTSAAK